MSKTITFLTVK